MAIILVLLVVVAILVLYYNTYQEHKEMKKFYIDNGDSMSTINAISYYTQLILMIVWTLGALGGAIRLYFILG